MNGLIDLFVRDVIAFGHDMSTLPCTLLLSPLMKKHCWQRAKERIRNDVLNVILTLLAFFFLLLLLLCQCGIIIIILYYIMKHLFKKNFKTISTQIWAQLFPFPQFYFGFASIFLVGPISVGALYLYIRVVSFIIAGQVHKRIPFNKLMGPIMHCLFYILVPYSIWWLLKVHNNKDDDNVWSTTGMKIHYWFVLYVTCITTISLIMDTIVLMKYLQGKDVGVFKQVNNSGEYEQVV